MILTEGEFFQSAAKCLGEHEVDEANFKGEPAAVRDEIFPADTGEADGIDKSGEKARETAKQLENGNALGALGISPHFDHVGCKSGSVHVLLQKREHLRESLANSL